MREKVYGMDKLNELVRIVEKLRSPDGCPWDKEQTYDSMISGFIEELHEYIDALKDNDSETMKEELGDILLHIVFQAQLAKEDKRFILDDVIDTINNKLIHRHPHVFGNDHVQNSDEVLENWEKIKQQEKGKEKRKYLTDGIPRSLPALLRANEIQKKAAKVGFDWDTIDPALDKVEEEFAEFRAALKNGDVENATEELGDIFFALVNVARFQKVSPEEALHQTNKKFLQRFNYVEDQVKSSSKSWKEFTLEELDCFWEESKKKLR